MTSTSRTQPCRSASRIIRPSRGSTGSRASRRPTVVSRAGRRRGAGRVERAELLEQLRRRRVIAAARRAARRTGSARRRRGPSAAICRMTDGQVGAQDLGLGELRAAVEVLLGVEPDAMPSARRGRSGRRAGWPRPGEIGSIGSRCTLVRADVAGDAGGARCRRRTGCRGRSARSRRRWWPARSGGRVCGCEDPVLLGGREPGVQRQRPRCRAALQAASSASAVSRISRSPEQEHQDVARALARSARSTASHDRLRSGRASLAVVVVLGADSGR